MQGGLCIECATEVCKRSQVCVYCRKVVENILKVDELEGVENHLKVVEVIDIDSNL